VYFPYSLPLILGNAKDPLALLKNVMHLKRNIFFGTQPKDAYLPNVENIAPRLGTGLNVATCNLPHPLVVG
jgi:hypothetical protein